MQLTSWPDRECYLCPPQFLVVSLLLSLVSRDGQFRIIYYSRIVKPNPESESFLVISTINMKAFIRSLQQQKHNQRTSVLQCYQILSAGVCIMRKQTHSINVCVCKLVFESLPTIHTFTKRRSVNKQCDKACKLDINRILLDSDSLRFESFRFSILNCPSLLVSTLVFSQSGGILSHQNSLTHRFPQYPLRNLCSLVMLAVSSLVFAAMDTAFF